MCLYRTFTIVLKHVVLLLCADLMGKNIVSRGGKRDNKRCSFGSQHSSFNSATRKSSHADILYEVSLPVYIRMGATLHLPNNQANGVRTCLKTLRCVARCDTAKIFLKASILASSRADRGTQREINSSAVKKGQL